MQGLRMSVVWTLCAVLLVSGAVRAIAQSEGSPEPAPVRILFVGNSLTDHNGGVEGHVAALAAESVPTPVEVEVATSGSATLLTHRYAGVADTISHGNYDIVVLQGDIPANLGQTELFLENARLLADAIEGSGARTVFFMTWPYENVEQVGLDDILAAHRQVQVELDAVVAPAAVALARARAERPDLALVVDGRGHPSPAGTYLAAATIYATLFERSAVGLSYRMEAMSEEDAAFLQRIAWEAVAEWQQPDEDV